MSARPLWPILSAVEEKAVREALIRARKDPSWLSSADGRGVIESFEKDFSSAMGARFSLSFSGGGPALHVALLSVGVRAGDEVVCPSYSWGQSAACALQANAIPVFADIDPQSYTMTARAIEAVLTPRTRAIVVAHLFGHPADMDPIMRLARRRKIPVVEDAAQAAGALYKGRRVGAIGDAGCFSIGSGKQIVGGEGGLLLTNSRSIFEQALFFGHHPQRHALELKNPELLSRSDGLIYTYRMHPLAAVIAKAMLPRLDRLNTQRRRNHERLARGLTGLRGIRPPAVKPWAEPVYHKFSPSFVPEEVPGLSRAAFVARLKARGVEASMGYVRTPIHLRRTFQEKQYFSGKGLPWSLSASGQRRRYRKGDCPETERRCEETELLLGGGAAWIGNQSRLADETAAACRAALAPLQGFR